MKLEQTSWPMHSMNTLSKHCLTDLWNRLLRSVREPLRDYLPKHALYGAHRHIDATSLIPLCPEDCVDIRRDLNRSEQEDVSRLILSYSNGLYGLLSR